MAEHRDAGPVRPRPGPYRFGVAAELDRDGAAAPTTRRSSGSDRSHPLDHPVWRCRARARAAPLHGRSWAHLRSWWASRDRHPGGLWRRTLCRFGRHQIRGGQQVQLGSRFVAVPRCCVWCGAEPAPLGPQSTTASGTVWPGMIR